jgi:GNAT superfamily N-acetyltransferase
MQAYIGWDLNQEELFDEDGNEYAGEEYALIEKIFVPVEDRGQGVGAKLLAEAIEEIRAAHGSITIKLAALPFGEGAMDMVDLVAYYERCGFEVESTEGHAVVMVLA